MRQTKVRSMVEGGLLAGIAIIFAIISAYLPVVGPFVNLLWPVPIILLGVRHGYKWSIMATVVAGVIIAMLLHPLQAVSVVVGFGLIGIVLGYAFRMEFSPGKTMLWGTLASLISKAALLGIGAAMTGINPFAMQSDVMAQAMEQGVEVYRNFGIAEQELAKMKESMETMLDLVKVILPAGFIMASVVDTFLNYAIAKTVLKKLGHTMPDFPPFKNWTLPDYIVYFFALALVMIYWGKSREIDLLYTIGMNIQVLTSTLLLVQGLSLFYYVVDKYNLSRMVRGIILFLILTNGLFSQILIFAGAIDSIIDYRHLRSPRKSG
ncbi:YybS family protein [Pelosinus sp. sgz500959]|uniref:YybS family protein n=1 Tax=Pelosinus sp. sgz500959 TaxID=3242472 RepID=UPI00366F8B92